MGEPPKQEDIDELMKALGAEAGKVPAPPPARPPASASRSASPVVASPLPLEPLGASPASRTEVGLEFLSDVEVNVRIELGTARLHVQDVLKLGPGSVVPLESLVGDPVDVFVNDRLVARGEVLVVNENFAVRITEVIPLPRSEKP
ncbi:MAG TPA: flagellar motor switch protein FliN [Planctomycetota bacterium]|nr:flagellar motor switch protein FliN [Planctomycetota bacterium]